MPGASIDRLVRKEVSLGAIRELPTPEQHIGLNFAPFMDVDTDDVIFDYIKGGLQDGMSPARAEDAEAELSQKDDLLYGSGRASIIDWALKDKYTASDVTRYREDLFMLEQMRGAGVQLNFNYTARHAQEFQQKIARDDGLRRRKLDNRIEWLIMTSLEKGSISYNDGRIKFTVPWGRPSDQQDTAPVSGELWGTVDSDPIGDVLAVKQAHYDKYGVELTRGIISKKILNSIWKSNRFLAAIGLPVIGGTPNVPLDPNYLGLAGYTPEGALRILEQATGVTFTIYDGVYRTRPIGGQTFTNVRFTDDRKVILLPGADGLGEIDDTAVGFAKTLTAPHPEANWQTGFYEWEDETKDPWMHVRGSGIKAFPVFPYLEYTHVMQVLA